MVPKRREVVIDPVIWSRLPADLLEHVLSLLPLKELLSLRSTCRHFNSLLISHSFLSRTNYSSAFSRFILLSHPQCRHDQFPLYESTYGTWRSLSLPRSLSLLRAGSSASAAGAAATTLLSSSYGLLCFSLPISSSFLVTNLLTCSARIINFPAHPFAFELLSLVSTPLGYKIFMLYTKSFPDCSFVYDSRVKSWSKFGTHDCHSMILSQSNHQEGVFYKGSLYFTTLEPFSVASFNLENGKWETEPGMMMPDGLAFARLVTDDDGECNNDNKLYMIGGVGRNGISTSMRLWELQQGSLIEGEIHNKWIEVERLPEMMCRKFMSVCYHNYENVYCFWHQGMICVCCYTWPEILYYNVDRRTWHWLPSCPCLPHKWSCGFRWFSFLPRLYALV